MNWPTLYRIKIWYILWYIKNFPKLFDCIKPDTKYINIPIDCDNKIIVSMMTYFGEKKILIALLVRGW